jgi:hypothetical protein
LVKRTSGWPHLTDSNNTFISLYKVKNDTLVAKWHKHYNFAYLNQHHSYFDMVAIANNSELVIASDPNKKRLILINATDGSYFFGVELTLTSNYNIRSAIVDFNPTTKTYFAYL